MLIQKGFKKIKKIIEISLVVGLVVYIAFSIYNGMGYKTVIPLERVCLATSKEGKIRTMEWSRDKKQVAFVKSREEKQETVNSLWIVDRNGRNERKLIEMDERQWGGWGHTFHWATDNKKIAFLVATGHTIETPEKRYSTQIIKTIDIDTGKIEELIPEDELGEFSWSPDGKKFIYWKGYEIWISSPDGKNRRKLVATLIKTKECEIICAGNYPYIPFIWSSDSKRFLMLLDYQEMGYIYQVDIAKGLFENLSHSIKCKIFESLPQWVGDKKHILFSTVIEIEKDIIEVAEDNTMREYTKLTPKYTIWMFNNKTKSVEKLTEGEKFSCSPDGKNIVYWKEKWEKEVGEVSTAISTNTISCPLMPDLSFTAEEFAEFPDMKTLHPPTLILEENVLPALTRKGNWYIMNINSRQIQKLPITINVDSDVMWLSKDTISYIGSLNGKSHIFLQNIKY